MKIAIVGAGAVGSYYGANLARLRSQNPDIDVHFLLRSDYEIVREHGIRVLSPQGDLLLNLVNAHQLVETIGACDLVVIAIKATANNQLLSLLPPLLHEDTMLLTLQNGLGNEEFLAGHFGARRVLGGKCFVCLNRIAPGVIKHIGHGVISLGEFRRVPQERTRQLAELFIKSGIECRLSDNIEEVLWRKLTWNIPFNGLSIVGGSGRKGVDVAQIIADAELLEKTRKLMREVIAVAGASGVLIEDEYVEFQIQRTRPMGPYKPSSMLDFEAGREVEIEPIWGEPLRRARNLKIPIPHLEQLYARLQTLVSRT